MLAGLSVIAQVLLPVLAFDIGRQYAEVAHLVLPYSIAAVLAVACGQAILVCVWRMLTLAAQGNLYGQQSLKLLDAARVFIVVGAALPALVCAHLLFVVKLGGPAVIIGLVTALVAAFAGLTMLTALRTLFLLAKSEHDELAQVI